MRSPLALYVAATTQRGMSDAWSPGPYTAAGRSTTSGRPATPRTAASARTAAAATTVHGSTRPSSAVPAALDAPL